MKNLALLSATAITASSGLLFGTIQAASASTLFWRWSYSGSGIVAKGTFKTNDIPDNLGFYQILEIAGTRNGETITTLQPVGTAIPGNEPFEVDNLIQQSGSQLTKNGFGYSTAGGNFSNPFFASFLSPPVYLDFFSAPPFTSGVEDSELPISFSATIINVPETNSILGLIALGTIGAGSVLKRNQRFKLTLKQLEKIS